MIENYFLNNCRKLQILITIYTINGYRQRGYVSAFDEKAIELADEDGNHRLIYIHAISTIET